MVHHAYIDESGTLDHQEVMTVAMVVLEGAITGQKIHKEIVTSLYPKYFSKKKPKQKIDVFLHYAVMNKEQKLAAAGVLAKHPVSCYAACFYHDGNEKSHEERFSIYVRSLKSCLALSFEHFEDLSVTIEIQGGAAGYRQALFASLNEVPDEFTRRGEFRKAKFGLKSGNKPGLQLADFYAGAIRDSLLAHKDPTLNDPHELIKHQVHEIKVETYENVAKAKG